MNRTVHMAGLALLAAIAVFGQAADPLTFEVASLKKAAPAASTLAALLRYCSGGPGSKDPGLYSCTNVSIGFLAQQAYGLKVYQLPDAYQSDPAGFDLQAKVPPGTTPEQLKLMLQNLLAERFTLVFHYEKKEIAVYDLVVAPGGLKMKESEPLPATADGVGPPAPRRVPDAQMEKGSDGFPIYAAPRNSLRSFRANGNIRLVCRDMGLPQVVAFLSGHVPRPVLDSTKLEGKYDFTLTFASTASVRPASSPDGVLPTTSDSGGPTIFTAVQKQLGLKLDGRKETIDLFVIDRVEKTAVEN